MSETLKTEKIYLVDDDRIICHSLNLILKKYGYVVEVYNSAEAFLEQYDDNAHGLLLVDQNMPGISGLELQTYLKNRDTNLKIIFITAVYESVKDQAIDNGALEVFEKPFDPKELVELINRYVVLQ